MKNKIILWILLLIVICLGSILEISAQSDYRLAEQDSLALVAFYWATDGPNWISNQEGFGFDDLSSEWQERYDGGFNKWFDGPAKDWFGVKVEKRGVPNSTDSTYRVTWLWPVIGRRTDGQNMLKGYIPREIGLLTALERIHINGNDGFSWEIVPDEMYHKSLQHFDVEACWFGGGISDAFTNCTDMRKINSRYNNFDYMPNLDFLSPEAVRRLEGTQWLYNSRLSFAILEKIIDYFYTISPNPQEFGLEMRDMFDVGDEIEIVAPIGSSVEMICNDAGEREEFITYQWFKDGLSRFGKTKKTFEIANVKESDYGDYTVRILNEYVKTYDQNGNYGEVLTKPIHLVPAPIPPVVERGVVANNGLSIDFYFSKPMIQSGSEFATLQVAADGALATIEDAEIRGRLNKIVRVHLLDPIQEGSMVSLNYNSDTIMDLNGGRLEAITDLMLENRTRTAPQILEAETTLDGSGVLLYFDQYIANTSLASADFAIEGQLPYEIASLTLAPGAVDADISKVVLATLSEPIVDTLEAITVQYRSGRVHGLYGGTLQEVGPLDVINRVSVDKYEVTISFEDGSEQLENLYVLGSWKVAPSPMYDDGTHGDKLANDHIWTYVTPLVDDDYRWNILMRSEVATFDTISMTDAGTGITTLTIVPKTIAVDSTLSENVLLEFSVADKSIRGDTVFGINNLDVIFNVSVDAGVGEVYLMGIEGDWVDGHLMQSGDDPRIFSDTIQKRTAGDLLEYNYRIGNDWENATPEPRAYIVKNGINIINDGFGIFTNTDDKEQSPISLYPNPSNGLMVVEGLDQISELTIYSISGRLINSYPNPYKNTMLIDITRQPKGIYILKGTSSSGKVYTHKIIAQ